MGRDSNQRNQTDDAHAPASDATGRPPSPEVLKLDHVYDALGHPRRRYLCYTLLEDSEWSLTELVTKIAAWEREVPEREVTDDHRERVYVALYHAHVPMLVDQDVISFDPDTETIARGTNAEQVLMALEGVGAGLDARQEQHALAADEPFDE